MAYSMVQCLAACIAFTVIVWIFLLIRFYVRWRFQTGYLIEEILAMLATLVYTALIVQFLIGGWKFRHANSTDIVDISPETRAETLKTFFTCELLYPIGTYLAKLCFTMALLRLTQHPALRLVLYLIIATGAVILVAAELHMLLYCHPVSYGWQRVINPDLEGSCQDVWTVKVVKLVHAAWILVSDITVGLIIPIILLWSTNLRPKVKILVQILLGLGSLASIATVIHIPYIVESIGLTDRLLHNIAIIFWSIIELAISIITMAAATWKPLLVRLGIISSYNQMPVRMESVVF